MGWAWAGGGVDKEESTVWGLLMEGQLSKRAECDSSSLTPCNLRKAHELFMHHCFSFLHLNRDYGLELGEGRQHHLTW